MPFETCVEIATLNYENVPDVPGVYGFNTSTGPASSEPGPCIIILSATGSIRREAKDRLSADSPITRSKPKWLSFEACEIGKLTARTSSLLQELRPLLNQPDL
jgi:hypothetical protein